MFAECAATVLSNEAKRSEQLEQALANGDLAGAQAAFDSIVKLGQSGPFAKGDPFAIKQREQEFAAIGQALQGGDLAGAQKAFSDLEATLQTGGRNQPSPTLPNGPNAPLPGIRPSSVGPEIVLQLPSPTAAGDPTGRLSLSTSASTPTSGFPTGGLDVSV